MSSEAAEKEAMEITVADLPMEFRVSKIDKFVIQNRIFSSQNPQKSVRITEPKHFGATIPPNLLFSMP